jgi:O-antigen/teichoic acid export membrane protein
MKALKLISFISIFAGLIIIILSIIDYIFNKEWAHWYATVFGIILIIVGITNFYRTNK